MDVCEKPKDEGLRKRVHIGMALAFVVCILLFRVFNSTSLIDAIYVMCSYTYGPLLGLFAFGLFTRKRINDRYVPFIAIASPLLCFALDTVTTQYLGYHFGYELLMLNGLITFGGLYCCKEKC